MFTPSQQRELNQVQANIKAAMDDLQKQIDQLKQQLKEHDHG
jgi:ribosome-associated translation inhibitor RaiA